MRLPSPSRRYALYAVLGATILCWSSTFAVTLEELRAVADLTPRKFARYFANFEYKFRREVQAPEVFLATESGDCDDYATLAARVLKEKGYTPRLIAVRMPNLTHVVCYIEETRSYLDYNARACLNRVIGSGPEISEIASKVAKSCHTDWASASEFTFEDGVKRLVKTEIKKEPRKFASVPRGSKPE